MSTEKTTLVVGGIVAVLVVIFLMMKSKSQVQVAALNQPGLIVTPSQARGGTLGEILDATQVGVSAVSNLRYAFGGGADSTSNDPGLYDQTDSAYYN